MRNFELHLQVEMKIKLLQSDMAVVPTPVRSPIQRARSCTSSLTTATKALISHRWKWWTEFSLEICAEIGEEFLLKVGNIFCGVHRRKM